MQVHTFLADSAADAVAQIRSQLGPQAVVLNVRPVSGEGLSRFFQKRRIEVLACLPETESAPMTALQGLMPERQDFPLAASKPDGSERTLVPETRTLAKAAWPDPASARRDPRSNLDGTWRIGSFLQNSGLLPVHVERIVDELRALHGDVPPSSLAKEIELAGALMRVLWNKPDSVPVRDVPSGTHVLIGAPGVGKTVCLCKWLAHTVLLEGRSACVWRLDGRTANTAEALSVYAEILGVPIERSLPVDRKALSDLLLVDFPGVNWGEAEAVAQLERQIQQLPNAKVHLVLNAAYETPLLLAQVRAFSALPIAGLILTHLDEEARWGKLWNLVLGTNFSVRYLSAGQNVPGDWMLANPDAILSRQFPAK